MKCDIIKMKIFPNVYIYLIGCFLVVLGCSSKKNNQFALSVNFSEDKDITIVNLLTDSINVIKSSENLSRNITFEEVISYPNLYSLKIGDEIFIIIALPNDDIQLNQISSGNWSITGSVDTRNFFNLQQSLNKTKAELNDLKEQFLTGINISNIDSLRYSLNIKADSVFINFKQELKSYIKENIDNLSCLLALQLKYDSEKSVFNSSDDFYLFKEVDEHLFKKYPEIEFVRLFHRDIERTERQLLLKNSNKTLLNKGARIFNIILPDSMGKNFYVNFFTGKYMYLHFVKSDINYNGTYMENIDPNILVKTEIVNIWIEDNFENWKDKIKQNELAGIQLCDTNKSDYSIYKKLGVEALPSGVLINRYGRIVSSHLRLENILDTINKIEKP